MAVPQNALPGAAEPAFLRPTDALWGWPVVAEVTLRLPKEHGGSLEDEPWGGHGPEITDWPSSDHGPEEVAVALR